MDTKLREARFEAMLRLAVIECYETEMETIPPQEELEKMYKFSDRHERRMRKLFARVRRMEIWKTVRKYSHRAAAVFVLILSLLFSALMLNGNVRAAVQKTFIEWFDKFTRFTFSGGAEIDADSEWVLTYVPDGFTESESFEVIGKTAIYTNEHDERLIFKYNPTQGYSIAIDNEDYDYSTFFDNGIEYHLFVPLIDYKFLSILWEQEGFAFRVTFEESKDQDELIKTALSVRKK